MDIDECIKKRCSVRRFKSKKPDWRKIIEAVEYAKLAPLAGNIPTIKFILVSDKEKITKLSEAAAQNFISQAHYVVVVCSDNNQCIRSYDERGKKYSLQQAGASIENFLLKLTDLKLATCWVGAFSDNSVKSILKIPDDIEVEALLPIGYDSQKLNQKPKPKTDSIIYFDKWKNKYMTPIKKVNAR